MDLNADNFKDQDTVIKALGISPPVLKTEMSSLNYWLLIGFSSTLVLIILVLIMYYCYMTNKNRSLLTVVSLEKDNKNDEKSGP